MYALQRKATEPSANVRRTFMECGDASPLSLSAEQTGIAFIPPEWGPASGLCQSDIEMSHSKEQLRTCRTRSTHPYGVRRRVAAFTVCGADGYRLHPPRSGSGLRPLSKRHRSAPAEQETDVHTPKSASAQSAKSASPPSVFASFVLPPHGRRASFVLFVVQVSSAFKSPPFPCRLSRFPKWPASRVSARRRGDS